MLAATAGLSQSENLFSVERKGGGHFNPDYRVPGKNKELREFKVGGKTVMAYSRKDAAKRLKHMGNNKTHSENDSNNE